MFLTIPAVLIRPGDLIDTATAVPAGPVVRVRDVATVGDRTHVVLYESGALVPDAYTFAADALVSRYSAR
jgi:hypothetical protein